MGADVFFDNLFTSFPLLDELSDMGIAGTGTVRQNRIHGIPIKGKKEMEHRTVARGTKDVSFRRDQVLVAWRDNKAVYMASNKYGSSAAKTCRRFSRVEQRYIQVPIPDMYARYNAGMGGVDLVDSMVALYRVPIRIKKWWWPFYAWSLSVSAVNAWRLRCKVRNIREPYLDFLRELVMAMLAAHGTPPGPRRSLTLAEDARYDQMGHWPANTETDGSGNFKRLNCRHCYEKEKAALKVAHRCKKCNVALHIKCFEESIYFSLTGISVKSKKFFFVKSKMMLTFSITKKPDPDPLIPLKGPL